MTRLAHPVIPALWLGVYQWAALTGLVMRGMLAAGIPPAVVQRAVLTSFRMALTAEMGA